MSRSSLRSVAVLAMVAAGPFAAHYVSTRSSGSSGASVVEQQSTGKDAASRREHAPDGGLLESAASPNASQVRDAGAAAQDAAQSALAGTVCNFLQQYSGYQPQLAAGKAEPTRSSPIPCAPGPHAVAPHVLLAILPDPVRTHLELRFDRGIDDLQDAAQDRGWQFDSDWIQWDNGRHEEPDRFGARLLDQAARRGRENTAGAILFRPSGENDRSADAPLIVLVAGDTPIAGVGSAQFHSAIQMWNSLRPGLAEQDELRILGPSFSGSVQSLVHMLPRELQAVGNPADPCGGVSVSIASGSVTGGEQLALLQKPGPGACVPREVVSFALDGEYESELLRLFLRNKRSTQRVAQLIEAESAFGSSLIEQIRNDKGTNKAEARANPYLVLHFPREISRLREAYEQNSIIGFGSSADGPRSELRFETNDQHRATDTIPVFASTQQTLAMESQMTELAATLNQERISTVLLGATDVFDEIFVARYLQQHSPRVTVIITDADLLFLRRGADAGLQNTYVATPWPLIPENQFWTADKLANPNPFAHQNPEINLHQSQGDQGARAAVLHLLPCPVGRQCNGAPNEYRSPLPNSPEFANRPPLWLSLIGRGQFAPLALVDSDLLERPATRERVLALPTRGVNLPALGGPAKPPAGVSVELPLQTKLLVAGVAILLFWHGMACARSRLDRRFAWSYALADAGQRDHRLASQAILSFAAIPALRLLLVPNDVGFSSPSYSLPWVVAILQLVAIGLAAWSLQRCWIGRHADSSAQARRLAFAGIFAVLLIPAGLIDGFLWPLLRSSGSSERVFFLYRCALMTPGISPSLTILLLVGAIAFWGHSYFARWAFFGHRIPDLPKNHATDLGCPSPNSVAPVTNLFSNSEPSRLFSPDRRTNLWIFIGSLLLVCFILCVSASWGPTSLEDEKFDIWARVLTGWLAAVILNDVAVAVWGWSLLHTCCLLPLKRSPLRWGFTWIKGFSWRRLWTSSYVLSPDLVFDYLSRMLQAIHRDWDRDPALITAQQELAKEYYGAEKKDEAWSANVAASLIRLHILLANRADQMLNVLQELWAEDRGPLTGSEEERGFELQKKSDDTLSLDRRAAEEFVALLYLGYIRMVLIQIRNRIVTASVSYVLLVWALTSYSWANHHAIIISLSGLLGLLSAGVIYIYSGMHRDDILSRTTETDPGKLDSEFFEKTIPTLGIPLLSLVATQFPEFSDLIFSFIEPGLRGH